MTPWQQHVQKWKNCTKCPLHKQRDQIVIARGTLPCDVMFCGEAPGDSENAIGQPFVGPAGHLLNRIIARAIPISITYALTNLVCCYPKEAKDAGTKQPYDDEIEACRPRLVEFITKVCKPRLIVAVGDLAETWMPNVGIDVVHIVHPSFILSKMPLAQQGYAINKATVTIATALEALV